MDENRRAKKRGVGRATRFLDLDAWIDATLYTTARKAVETWDEITIFFQRFRVRGVRRLVVEIFSEGATMCAVGVVVLAALAKPAFEEINDDWRTQDDYAVTFLDRYGNEIGERGIRQRESVPLEEMPDHVIKAVLGTEDRRFFDHFGIDLIGLSRAMAENMRANGVVQGGSTITQQLAKNLFLSNEQTLERKVKEAFLALWLETNLTKKEILQLYLDRTYFGGRNIGISAAADFYFGKRVQNLTLAEAAMIAGLFKAPSHYAPHVNLPAARARAHEVLSNLVQAGFMSEGQVMAARLNPATPIERNEHDSPDYFLDWAFEQVKDLIPPGGSRSVIARTTIDPELQEMAEDSLQYHLRRHGNAYRVKQGAIVLLDTNGAVRAMVGGRDYSESQFNRATNAERQPGSSFKPYVYALAMEEGFKPTSIIPDVPIAWGDWKPQNYTRSYAGRVNLTTALVRSINTVPVRLAHDHLGIGPIQDLVESMGVETELNGHKTMVLGTSAMTVMDQATGFSVFASGGYAGLRHGITQLRTHSGEVSFDFYRDAPPPRRVLSEQAVSSLNSMLVQVPEAGTGRRAALPMVRSAGKTGTTQSYRDGWYVGFTGNYVGAVWLGNDNYAPTNDLTGGSLPAMVWQRMMANAHQGIELKPIPGISNPLPGNVQQVADNGENGEDGDAQHALSSDSRYLFTHMKELFRQSNSRKTAERVDNLSAL